MVRPWSCLVFLSWELSDELGKLPFGMASLRRLRTPYQIIGESGLPLLAHLDATHQLIVRLPSLGHTDIVLLVILISGVWLKDLTLLMLLDGTTTYPSLMNNEFSRGFELATSSTWNSTV